MKTYVVQIADNNLMFGNFLPRRFEYEEKEFRIINGDFPTYSFDGRKVTSAVDIYFNTQDHLDSHAFGVDWRVGVRKLRQNDRVEISVPVFGKLRQTLGISQVLRDLLPEITKDFYEIECYGRGQERLVPRGQWVIKPENSARGCGHLVFDTDQVTPTKIYETLLQSGSESDFVHKLNGGDDKNYIGYYQGQEHTANEGYNYLKAAYGYFRYVPDVMKEYRIITGYNSKPIYVIERKRVKGTNEQTPEDSIQYYQAQSDTVDKYKTTLKEAGVDDKLIPAIEATLSAMNIPLHSVDLFVTASGWWGIFEYSYEFGTKAVPTELLREAAMKYVSTLVP
jgi:hypothetical protein